jgi:hypothetical protein
MGRAAGHQQREGQGQGERGDIALQPAQIRHECAFDTSEF